MLTSYLAMDRILLVFDWLRSRHNDIGSVREFYHVNLVTLILGPLCIYFIYVLIYGLFLCPIRHIPGPFLTRFGKWQFYYSFLIRKSIFIDIHELHKKYGPVVRVSHDIVDITLPEVAVKAWAGRNPTKLPWDKEADFCRIVRNGMKVDNILSLADARRGLHMRRLVGAPFAKKFLLDQQHIFKQCTKRMIEALERLRETQDNKVDMALQFKKYAFDVITEFAFGGYFKGASIRTGVSEVQLFTEVGLCNALSVSFPTIFKILLHIPWKKVEWTHSRDEFIKICDISIQEYKAKVKPGSRKDSLGTLIASKDDDGIALSNEELVSNASIFIFAGVDTTSTALTYIVYLLEKNPEFIRKLAQELLHYKDIDEFEATELENMPLLNAVIREGLRLYPPASSPIARITPIEGESFGGYYIPGGINVGRGSWTICRDPDLYPDPESFKPDRWLDLTREDETRLWDQSMIFSYGPRVCLGKEMALFELRMLLAALVLKYSWTRVPDKPDGWDKEMEPLGTGIIHPRSGKCVLKLESR